VFRKKGYLFLLRSWVNEVSRLRPKSGPSLDMTLGRLYKSGGFCSLWAQLYLLPPFLIWKQSYGAGKAIMMPLSVTRRTCTSWRGYHIERKEERSDDWSRDIPWCVRMPLTRAQRRLKSRYPVMR